MIKGIVYNVNYVLFISFILNSYIAGKKITWTIHNL